MITDYDVVVERSLGALREEVRQRIKQSKGAWQPQGALFLDSTYEYECDVKLYCQVMVFADKGSSFLRDCAERQKLGA